MDWTGSPPFGRRASLTHALDLLEARVSHTPQLIVEIGTSEAYSPDGLGNAMLAFAYYVGHYGAWVKSVDVRRVDHSKEILEKYCPQYAAIPQLFLADAFDWVTTIDEPIDFLYMDAGFELASDPEYGAFARRFADTIPSWYVELFKRFDPECFQPGALMLFDDTDPKTFFGKGMFLIPKLLQEGWQQIALRGEDVFPMALLEKL